MRMRKSELSLRQAADSELGTHALALLECAKDVAFLDRDRRDIADQRDEVMDLFLLDLAKELGLRNPELAGRHEIIRGIALLRRKAEGAA